VDLDVADGIADSNGIAGVPATVDLADANRAAISAGAGPATVAGRGRPLLGQSMPQSPSG
jgi:hypothetical protein